MNNISKFLLTTLCILIFTSCSGENQKSNQTEELEEPQELIENATSDPYLINNFEEAPNGVVRIVTKSAVVDINDQGNFDTVEFESTGSGFFISENGTIVTNNHVVASAVTIDVYIQGETRSYPAKKVGSSECDDLAILKIEKNENYYFELHNNVPVLGEEILAIGYPKGDEEITFLDGIVSKKEADGSTPWSSIDFAFEHTAEILPGSSGGPILNEKSQVLGIAYAGNEDGQEFGIPIVLVKEIINNIVDGTFNNILPINFEQFEGYGSYVYSVDKSSKLYESGIDGGEIITGINDLSIVDDVNAKTLCQVIKSTSNDENITLEFIETTGIAVAILIKSDETISVLDGHIFVSQANSIGKLENKIGPITFTESFKEECYGDYPNPELNEVFISDNKIVDDFLHPYDNSEKNFSDYTLESAKKSYIIAAKICWSKNFGSYEIINGYVSPWSMNSEKNCRFGEVSLNIAEEKEYPSQVVRNNSTIYIFQYEYIVDRPDSLEEAFTDWSIENWKESYKEDGCKTFRNDYIPINSVAITLQNEATKDVCEAEWKFITRYGNPEAEYIMNGNNEGLRELAIKDMFYVQQYNDDEHTKKVECGYNLSSVDFRDLNCKRNYGCPTPKYSESRLYFYLPFDVDKTIINSKHPIEVLDQYFEDTVLFDIYGHFHIQGVPALFFNYDE